MLIFYFKIATKKYKIIISFIRVLSLNIFGRINNATLGRPHVVALADMEVGRRQAWVTPLGN